MWLGINIHLLSEKDLNAFHKFQCMIYSSFQKRHLNIRYNGSNRSEDRSSKQWRDTALLC